MSIRKYKKWGTVGEILGYGTYGFVCEWKDGSGSAKAVKILDPDYVTKNSIAAPRLNQILSSASVYLRTEQSAHEQFCAIAINEAYASEKLAGTKNKHLMTILDGSQAVTLFLYPRERRYRYAPKREILRYWYGALHASGNAILRRSEE